MDRAIQNLDPVRQAQIKKKKRIVPTLIRGPPPPEVTAFAVPHVVQRTRRSDDEINRLQAKWLGARLVQRIIQNKATEQDLQIAHMKFRALERNKQTTYDEFLELLDLTREFELLKGMQGAIERIEERQRSDDEERQSAQEHAWCTTGANGAMYFYERGADGRAKRITKKKGHELGMTDPEACRLSRTAKRSASPVAKRAKSTSKSKNRGRTRESKSKSRKRKSKGKKSKSKSKSRSRGRKQKSESKSRSRSRSKNRGQKKRRNAAIVLDAEETRVLARMQQTEKAVLQRRTGSASPPRRRLELMEDKINRKKEQQRLEGQRRRREIKLATDKVLERLRSHSRSRSLSPDRRQLGRALRNRQKQRSRHARQRSIQPAASPRRIPPPPSLIAPARARHSQYNSDSDSDGSVYIRRKDGTGSPVRIRRRL
jgi:hypothetical protein